MDRSPYSEASDMVELATPPRILTVESLPAEDETLDKPAAENSDNRPVSNGHL